MSNAKPIREYVVEHEDESISYKRTIVRIFKNEDRKGDALIVVKKFEGVRYINSYEEIEEMVVKRFVN